MRNRMFVFLNDDIFPVVSKVDLREVIKQWYAAKKRRPGTVSRDYEKYYARRCFRQFFQKAHDVKRKNIMISEEPEEPECPNIEEVE